MRSPPWEDLSALSRSMADAFIRNGRSRWIDIAFAEGWERSLRDLVKTAIYQQVQNGGATPTLDQLDRFPMSKDDHAYYRNNGSRLLEVERAPIMQKRGVKPSDLTEQSKRMVGGA